MNYKENRDEVRSKVQTFKVTAQDKELFKELCKNRLKKKPATVLREYVENITKKEWTKEELIEKILYICERDSIHPHQLMLALQNRMDLT